MDNYNSVLTLQNLVFDEITFERKGLKNENELKTSIEVKIGVNKESVYRVTIVLKCEKIDEYNISISLSGFFKISSEKTLDENMVNNLISKNTVAIMMPYLRSELSLLTAQPETEPVVLPPLNINNMLNKS